jgi:DNA-binding transcriptional LysR family regulator
MHDFAWDDVRLLLTLLRAQRTEQAANQLDVDRSTITRRLSVFEKNVGARLFARTRDGLKPTKEALRLRPLAEAMELAATALGNAAGESDPRVEGRVRIATTEALASLLVAEGLLTMNDQHPELAIELVGGNKPVDVARGEADVALRVSAVREAALRVRCIARTGIGLFASPSYVHARGGVSSRGGLDGHDILLPTGELARLPESRWLSSRKEARIVFRSNSMNALIAAAIAGRGLVPLNLSWGRSNAGLEEVRVLEQIPKRPLWLVTRLETPKRGAVQVVSDRVASIVTRVFPR